MCYRNVHIEIRYLTGKLLCPQLSETPCDRETNRKNVGSRLISLVLRGDLLLVSSIRSGNGNTDSAFWKRSFTVDLSGLSLSIVLRISVEITEMFRDILPAPYIGGGRY